MFSPFCSLCNDEDIHQKTNNQHYCKNLKQFLKIISEKMNENFRDREREKKVYENLESAANQYEILAQKLFNISQNIRESVKLLKEEIKQNKTQNLKIFSDVIEAKNHQNLKESLQKLEKLISVQYYQNQNQIQLNNIEIQFEIKNEEINRSVRKYQNYVQTLISSKEELDQKVQKIFNYSSNPHDVEPTFKMVQSGFGNSLLINQFKTYFTNSQQILSSLPQTIYTSRSFGPGDKSEIVFDIVEFNGDIIPNHFFIGIVEEKFKDKYSFTEGVCLACNNKSKSMICQDYTFANKFNIGSRYKIFIDVSNDTFQVFQLTNTSEKLIFSLNPLKFQLSQGKWLPTITWDMKNELKIDILSCNC